MKSRPFVPRHGRPSLCTSAPDGALREVLKHDFMKLIRGTDVAFTAKGEVTGKAFGLSFTVPLSHDQTLNTTMMAPFRQLQDRLARPDPVRGVHLHPRHVLGPRSRATRSRGVLGGSHERSPHWTWNDERTGHFHCRSNKRTGGHLRRNGVGWALEKHQCGGRLGGHF